MEWKSSINKDEDQVNAPNRILHDQDCEVTVAGEKYIVKFHKDLNCLFYRRPDENCFSNINVRRYAIHKTEGSPEYAVNMELKCSDSPSAKAFSGETWVYTPASEQRRKAQAAQGATMRSPMTGKVLKVPVKNGDEVTKGDPIVVIEAMKMENNIGAVADGVIEGLTIKVDDNVNANDLLCKISPS